MNPHGNRARLGGILAVLAAAVALVALPGIASARHGNDDLADAGTIQSFDSASGVLTVDLTEGGSVSGLITPRTHIQCDNGRHRGRNDLRRDRRRHGRDATASDRGRGRGGDDGEGEGNDRRGEEEPGDDRGEAPEAGEDNDANGDDPPGQDGTAPGRSEGPGQGDERSARCTTDDLTAGKTVKFAELLLVDGKAIFKVVVLPATEEEEGQGEAGAPPSA